MRKWRLAGVIAASKKRMMGNGRTTCRIVWMTASRTSRLSGWAAVSFQGMAGAVVAVVDPVHCPFRRSIHSIPFHSFHFWLGHKPVPCPWASGLALTTSRCHHLPRWCWPGAAFPQARSARRVNLQLIQFPRQGFRYLWVYAYCRLVQPDVGVLGHHHDLVRLRSGAESLPAPRSGVQNQALRGPGPKMAGYLDGQIEPRQRAERSCPWAATSGG